MGIYIHIPFCRNKCFYCGFYSTVSQGWRARYIEAMKREIDVRADYLSTNKVETLYFGGGTPSLLFPKELEELLIAINDKFIFPDDAEKTLEVNPEDISPEHLKVWQMLGFNRISIGVQSFNDDILSFINRLHSGKKAEEGVILAAESGFDNISVDFIIGIPGQSEETIIADIDLIRRLPVDHVSVYMLSVDQGSVFEVQRRKGIFTPVDEDIVAAQYLKVCELLKGAGFEHYEISNFMRSGKYSRHNSAYWRQMYYIGFGTAAHSYDGDSRQWNIANIKKYVEALERGTSFGEREELSGVDRYNELIMTGLRTVWGVNMEMLLNSYPSSKEENRKIIERYIERGDIITEGEKIRMTEKGWLISDCIFSDLFVV